MNKVIIKALTATGLTIGLGSCGVNSWNDEMLDGFEPGTDYNNPTTNVSYTLTESDYQTIAKLMEAIATTDAEKAEAKAIATNLYLNSEGSFPATTALLFLTTCRTTAAGSIWFMPKQAKPIRLLP